MALTYSTLNTVTRDYFDKVLIDIITQGTPTLDRLWKKRKTKGGNNLDWPIEYNYNTSATSYAKNATLTPVNTDFETKAVLDWSFYDVGMKIYYSDIAKNQGSEVQMRDLVEDTLNNGAKSLVNLLSTDLFGTHSSTEIYGLYDIVSGTSTYAGISPTDVTSWKATVDSTTTTLTPTLLYKAITTATYGTEGAPTFAVTTKDLYSEYMGKVIDPKVQYVRYDGAENWLARGMEIAKLGTIDLTWDRYCASGSFFLLDEENIQFVTLPVPNISDVNIRIMKLGFMHTSWLMPSDGDYISSHLRVYLQLQGKTRRTNYLFSALTGVSAT